MAQSACGERAAFDMLRRASQRSNVPVRDLAATIVAQAAQHGRTGSGRGRNPVR
jgi:AmiR/NasT family two-component response regulator